MIDCYSIAVSQTCRVQRCWAFYLKLLVLWPVLRVVPLCGSENSRGRPAWWGCVLCSEWQACLGSPSALQWVGRLSLRNPPLRCRSTLPFPQLRWHLILSTWLTRIWAWYHNPPLTIRLTRNVHPAEIQRLHSTTALIETSWRLLSFWVVYSWRQFEGH